jgi:hypothetical protein
MGEQKPDAYETSDNASGQTDERRTPELRERGDGMQAERAPGAATEEQQASKAQPNVFRRLHMRATAAFVAWLNHPSRERPKWTDVSTVILSIAVTFVAVTQCYEMHSAGKQTDRLIENARLIESHQKQMVLDNQNILKDNRTALDAALKENRDELAKALKDNRDAAAANSKQLARMAGASEKSAEAANESLVTLLPVVVDSGIGGDSSKGPLTIAPGNYAYQFFENIGGSAAYGRIYACGAFYPHGVLPSPIIPCETIPRLLDVVIQKGHAKFVRIDLGAFTDTLVDDINANRVHLYIFAGADYGDKPGHQSNHIDVCKRTERGVVWVDCSTEVHVFEPPPAKK